MIVRSQIEVDKDVLKRWQNIVDILADVIAIPAALIMRLVDDDIEVFVTSNSPGNPYHVGDREHFFDSGLYCETVIRSNAKLLIPNALKDEHWKNNPDVQLNMISYLGFPILLPDGSAFGTICVLDNKENSYSTTYEDLIVNFREIIQSQLAVLYMNAVLGERNAELLDYIDEIKTLRGIIPICTKCKKIRDDAGFWIQVEKYIEDHSEAQFSHGLCEACGDELYGDQLWYQQSKKK